MARSERQELELLRQIDESKALGDMRTELKVRRALDDLRNPKAEQQIDPAEGMTPLQIDLAGAGKAYGDAGMGLQQLLAGTYRPLQYDAALKGESDYDKLLQEQQTREARDAPLMAHQGARNAHAATEMLFALAPGAAGKTVPSGMLLGAGYGAAQPVTPFESRGGNTVSGAIGGAVAPLSVYGANVAQAATEPFTATGPAAIAARILRRVAGNDADAIRERMARAPMLVPGVQPTAAEVADSGGIAALQRAAGAIDPQAYASRETANNAARVQSLRGIAKDKPTYQAAEAARDSAAKKNYGKAWTAPVWTNKDPVLKNLTKRPEMREAMTAAERLREGRGPTSPVQYLHHVQMALRDMASGSGEKGIGAAQRDAINETRNELLGWMDKNIPAYAKARKNYAEMSKPLAQMDVGEELLNKMQPALGAFGADARLNRGQYAKAVRDADATAKRATDFKGATLEGTLTPKQMATVNNLARDLARRANADELGQGVNSDSVQKLAMTNIMEKAGLPVWASALSPRLSGLIGGVASRGAGVLYKDAGEKVQRTLANLLLNPKESAAAMRELPTSAKKKAMLEILRQAVGTGAVGGPEAVKNLAVPTLVGP